LNQNGGFMVDAQSSLSSRKHWLNAAEIVSQTISDDDLNTIIHTLLKRW
jgi:hypothetical protein